MSKTLSELAGDDYISGCELVEREEELKDERAALVEAMAEAIDIPPEDRDGADDDEALLEAEAELKAWDEENQEELSVLEALHGEAEDDLAYVQFILDSEFTSYAEEYARDCNLLSDSGSWPACHIDWDAAAEALKQDFNSVEIGDHTYYVR
jgi:hypothetical protein